MVSLPKTSLKRKDWWKKTIMLGPSVDAGKKSSSHPNGSSKFSAQNFPWPSFFTRKASPIHKEKPTPLPNLRKIFKGSLFRYSFQRDDTKKTAPDNNTNCHARHWELWRFWQNKPNDEAQTTNFCEIKMGCPKRIEWSFFRGFLFSSDFEDVCLYFFDTNYYGEVFRKISSGKISPQIKNQPPSITATITATRTLNRPCRQFLSIHKAYTLED